MIATFTCTRIEVVKLFKSKRCYVGFAGVLAFLAMMVLGFIMYQADVQHQFRYQDAVKRFNGLTFATYALIYGNYMVLPIFVTLVAGAIIASEHGEGTLRMMCTRPVGRLAIFTSKTVAAALYTLLLFLFFQAAALAVGGVKGWGDVEMWGWPLWIVDHHTVVKESIILGRMPLALLLGSWSLMVLVALALLLSVMTRSAVLAVVIALIIYMLSYSVGAIELFGVLKPYLFTTHMSFWKKCFAPEIPWAWMWREIAYCGIYIFGCLTAAMLIFARRDITT